MQHRPLSAGPHRRSARAVGLVTFGALAALAVSSLPAGASAPTTTPSTSAAAAVTVVDHTRVEATRTVLGQVFGPLERFRDGVFVEARTLTGRVASSAITYGGQYELHLSPGTYTVTYSDSPDATYEVAGQRTRVVVGLRNVRLPDVYLLFDGPRALRPPTLRGEPRASETLRVDPGTWDLDDARFDYTWIRDQKILPVEGRTYELTAADVGHVVRVRVTASLPLHETGTATTEAVTIARGESEVDADAARSVVRRRDEVVISGRVAAARGGRGGAVQIFEGTRPTSRPVRLGRDGSFRVEVPVSGRGRHTYLVRFTGNAWFAPAWSDVVRVTVR